MLARISQLAGRWEGTFAWSGARTTSGRIGATYALTGNGSAVVETLILDNLPAMTTVYHLDGADLRMTHYCAAMNQARLKANRIDLSAGTLNFVYIDATNLASATAPHVHGFEMRMTDSTHLVLDFLFTTEGRESHERIVLTRTS